MEGRAILAGLITKLHYQTFKDSQNLNRMAYRERLGFIQ
jgi:hypothetical protein